MAEAFRTVPTAFALPLYLTAVEELSYAEAASVLDVPDAIDMATVYVPPEVGVRVMDDLAKKQIGEVWLNPGADGDEVVARAKALGLKTVIACSIIGIGDSPSRY